MEQEAASTPNNIALQLEKNAPLWKEVVDDIKRRAPNFAITLARGSSDHAATFAKYLLEIQLGMMTCSAAPSVFTLYETPFSHANSLVLGLSQSGRSPDLFETMQKATNSGAMTVAMVNDEASPLAHCSKFVLPLNAGEEKAVAATKSYIATLVALTHFIAIYQQNHQLLVALKKLPYALEKAIHADWYEAIAIFKSIDSAYVIGRGYGFPIAQEAALKFKETSSIHVEAFSSAEVLHGPFALIKQQFPTLIFAQNDASLSGVIDLTRRITNLGATTLLALPKTQHKVLPANLPCSVRLPLPESIHPILDPILSIQAFYMMAAKLAVERGMNPDQPNNLQKVTETR